MLSGLLAILPHAPLTKILVTSPSLLPSRRPPARDAHHSPVAIAAAASADADAGSVQFADGYAAVEVVRGIDAVFFDDGDAVLPAADVDDPPCLGAWWGCRVAGLIAGCGAGLGSGGQGEQGQGGEDGQGEGGWNGQ